MQQDAKLFLYIYILLMVFRIAFLLIYSGQLSEARAEDVAAALWLGARISLKTTAFLVAFPFVFGTIPYAIWGRWPAGRIRAILGSVAVGLMTLLFVIRIPYYEIFHQGFNIMLFNGMKDDKWAIWDTAVKQYQFWPRLLGAILLMALVHLAVAEYPADAGLAAAPPCPHLDWRGDCLCACVCHLLPLWRGVPFGQRCAVGECGSYEVCCAQ